MEFAKYGKSNKKYTPIPKYPAVERDIALVVDENVEVGQIESIISKKAKNILFLIIVLVVLTLLGGGLYYILSPEDDYCIHCIKDKTKVISTFMTLDLRHSLDYLATKEEIIEAYERRLI